MANICWMKCDIDNRAKLLKSTKGLLHCPKISWTLLHKRLKTGREFLPNPHDFVLSQSIAQPLCGINLAPNSDSKRNGSGFVCSSDMKLQKETVNLVLFYIVWCAVPMSTIMHCKWCIDETIVMTMKTNMSPFGWAPDSRALSITPATVARRKDALSSIVTFFSSQRIINRCLGSQ